MQSKYIHYLGLALVAAIWGANFGFLRVGMERIDPILFAFLRFGLAVPIFFLLLRFKEGNIGVPFKVAVQLMFIGLFGVTLLEIMVVYSIQYTTLANASLLNVAPWPIFAALFAPLFTKETITARVVVGGCIAMVGVGFIILSGGEGFNLSSNHMLGNGLAFAVSILGALYNVSCMPIMRKYSALRLSAWICLFGSIFMFPLTIGSWGKVEWSALEAVHYSIIAYNVLFATVLGFIVWNACMHRLGAARSNFFRYLAPATAVVAGYLMFDESIAWGQIIGAIFMAAGLIWISLERKLVGREIVDQKVVK